MGLRLAIDARYPRESFPGIGRHLDNLLAALPSVLEPGDQLLALTLDDRRLPAAVQRLAAPLRPRSLAEQLCLPAVARASRADVLLSPYAFTALRAPCPRALLVYDTIALDEHHGLRPAWRRVVARAWLRMAAGRSATLITLSEAARGALAAAIGAGKHSVTVTGSAPDPAFRPQPPAAVAEARQALGLPREYFVHLGANRPHKNVGALLRAFAASGLPARGLGLALAGPGHEPRRDEPPGVRRLGRVGDPLLPGLLAGAAARVLPSLDEGFGLPALEAMACGSPVAAASRGALPEVLGGAGLLFDPLDEPQLAQALQRLADDGALRAELRARGPARAASFSWPDVAARTLAACRAAAGRATPGRRAA